MQSGKGTMHLRGFAELFGGIPSDAMTQSFLQVRTLRGKAHCTSKGFIYPAASCAPDFQ